MVTSDVDVLARARAAAAGHLAERGYSAEADAIRGGRGDDFAEVRIAMRILADEDERLGRLALALAAYAAPSFWEEDRAGASEAAIDAGTIARAALTDTPPPAQHYD